MAQSKNRDRKVGKHRPVLIDSLKWAVLVESDTFVIPDLLVVRCTRHYKGPKTDEILGVFQWDEWESCEMMYDIEVARIVKEIIPDATWCNYDELSTLYSKAMNIMMEDKSIPFTYAMTFKGSWLTEVHNQWVEED